MRNKLLLIGAILTVIHAVAFSLPHFNLFDGTWRPTNANPFDVIYGTWIALLCVWVNRKEIAACERSGS